MFDLIKIYMWSIISGVCVGAALSLMGAQLASRGEAMKSFLLSQAAALGILIALMLEILVSPDHKHELGLFPILMGFITSTLLFYALRKQTNKNEPSKNTYYLSIFAIFLAIESICIALVPGLDGHAKNSYIGDLSLISNIEAQFISVISLIILIYLWCNWKKISYSSFLKNTFDQYLLPKELKKCESTFIFMTLSLITLSIELLGLLFTLSCLFIPIVMIHKRSLNLQMIKSSLIFITLFGVTTGIFLSFNIMKFPTVPAITITIVLLSYLISRRPNE